MVGSAIKMQSISFLRNHIFLLKSEAKSIPKLNTGAKTNLLQNTSL